jgi:hypothetical protein
MKVLRGKYYFKGCGAREDHRTRSRTRFDRRGAVQVTVQPWPGGQNLPPGEGLRRAFGAWAEDGKSLDQFLEWNRQQRKMDRHGIPE